MTTFIFGNIMKKNHKVYFYNKNLPYTGVPFIILSWSTPDCQQEIRQKFKSKSSLFGKEK